jgi:hypothetical protein
MLRLGPNTGLILEHRVAMRLEGRNESVLGSILRDGRASARPPQMRSLGIAGRRILDAGRRKGFAFGLQVDTD